MRDKKGKFTKGHIHFAKGSKLKQKNIKCEICKNSFWYYPSLHKKRKYCSNKCYGISRIGNTDGFTTEKSIGNRNGFKKGNKPWNYLDGRSKTASPARYGDDWEAIRYLVYLRDKFTCQHCGIKGIGLHIHHKIPFLQTFDNSLKNLITLCPSCHRKEDARIIKEIKLKEVILCQIQQK